MLMFKMLTLITTKKYTNKNTKNNNISILEQYNYSIISTKLSYPNLSSNRKIPFQRYK